MNRLFRLRRRGDILASANAIADFRYANTLDRVEPLVKAGVIPPPSWLEIARMVPPAIPEPLKMQKRLVYPTDRLVYLYQKRNPHILEEPLDLRHGGEPSVALAFAHRQLAAMQSGMSEADAYVSIEREMERERAAIVGNASTIVRRVQEDPEGGIASLLANDTLRSGVDAWNRAITTRPYRNWELGAKVALDMYLIRTVFGVSRTEEKHMAEINDGGWEHVEHEASLLRVALFPDTSASGKGDSAVFSGLPAWKTLEEIADDPLLAIRAEAFRVRCEEQPNFWHWTEGERQELLEWVAEAVILRDNVAAKVADSIDYFAYKEGSKDALTQRALRPFLYDAISSLFPTLELLDPMYLSRLKRADAHIPGTVRRVWEARQRLRRNDSAEAARQKGGGEAGSASGAYAKALGETPRVWPRQPPRRPWGAGPLLDEAINNYLEKQDTVVRQGMRRKRRQQRRAALYVWQLVQAQSTVEEARRAEAPRAERTELPVGVGTPQAPGKSDALEADKVGAGDLKGKPVGASESEEEIHAASDFAEGNYGASDPDWIEKTIASVAAKGKP